MPEAFNSNSQGSVRGRSISRFINPRRVLYRLIQVINFIIFNTAGVGEKRVISATDVTMAIGV